MAAAFLVMGDDRYVNLNDVKNLFFIYFFFFFIIIDSDVGRRKGLVLVVFVERRNGCLGQHKFDLQTQGCIAFP
jgi:hypothetical protein